MKITSADYVISARSASDYPPEKLPRIAFVGRSNVGKSSLINTLLKRKKTARISSTPGKTRSINFFLINSSFHFVDLPGYGYARVPRDEQKYWAKMIQEFLQNREAPLLVVLLVDVRHAPSVLDLQMQEWLVHFSVPHVIAATKSDKLSGNQRQRSLAVLRRAFDGSDLIPFSAVSELGRLNLWGRIETFLHTEE
ncbi:MAG: ribosome biogenesis GTP-binding protein YihA/YsxC [Anaerolineae bacterium]